MTRRRLTPRQRSAILAVHGGLCALCGRPVGCVYQLDHRLALALGGADEAANLDVVHPVCHRRLKTVNDVRMIRKANRVGKKHRGEKRPKGTICSAGFPKHLRRKLNGTVERRTP